MTHTPGPWLVATSNSWRRIVSRDHGSVCEPIVQNDGHPDLRFKNGGEDGPDARLLAAAPDLLEALRGLLADIQDYQRINNLGGENNHWQVIARAALGKAEGTSFPAQVNQS